jgi:hypothetical protein
MKLNIGFLNGWTQDTLNLIFGVFFIRTEESLHISIGAFGLALTFDFLKNK